MLHLKAAQPGRREDCGAGGRGAPRGAGTGHTGLPHPLCPRKAPTAGRAAQRGGGEGAENSPSAGRGPAPPPRSSPGRAPQGHCPTPASPQGSGGAGSSPRARPVPWMQWPLDPGAGAGARATPRGRHPQAGRPLSTVGQQPVRHPHRAPGLGFGGPSSSLRTRVRLQALPLVQRGLMSPGQNLLQHQNPSSSA